MFLDVLLEALPTSTPQRLGNINPSRDIGNGRKTSGKTLSPYAKRVGMIALVIAVACMAPGSFAQTAKESINVPPHSDATAVPWLLLESVGGTGRLGAVRFIQRTGTHGGNVPDGSCSQNAMRRVPYTATYSFYGAGQ
jgi:hypothetical protein